MSHERRTPLSATAGYAEILQLGIHGPLNDTHRADLSRIQANQAHLLRIINDMLDLTQIESGQLAMMPRPVQFHEVFVALEPIVAPLIAERALHFRVDADVAGFVLVGESERLTQVLVKLVANAIRFTDPNGSITISPTSRGGRVGIHVTDTGVGITPAKHAQVFQPFVQVDGGPARRVLGTGLGLAISRRSVEAMRGTLTVASAVGIGSTFTIDLERADEQPQVPAEAIGP